MIYKASVRAVGLLQPTCLHTLVRLFRALLDKLLIFEAGFLIIWAKLSDIFGRKLLVIASLCLFVAFSGACGAA